MVEKVDYKVIRTLDRAEVREYPRMLLATVTAIEDDSSFGILFNYISGNNQSRKKIPMTAPVVSSERISMTAPVVSGDRFFTFVMPGHYTFDTVPRPLDPRINIHVQPARRFAVLRFNGRAGRNSVEKRSKELLNILARHNVKTRGEVFLMRYNSPFTPGVLRRNEVGIEVV